MYFYIPTYLYDLSVICMAHGAAHGYTDYIQKWGGEKYHITPNKTFAGRWDEGGNKVFVEDDRHRRVIISLQWQWAG